MILSDNLKKNNIMLNVSASDRWQLFDIMINLAVKNGNILQENRNEITETLTQREKSMTTGIGKGIAIPHCMSSKVDNITIVLATLKTALEFDSIDNEPVHIVVLLLVPKNQSSLHIKALADIARMLNNAELREKIRSYKTADSVFKLIKEFDPQN